MKQNVLEFNFDFSPIHNRHAYFDRMANIFNLPSFLHIITLHWVTV